MRNFICYYFGLLVEMSSELAAEVTQNDELGFSAARQKDDLTFKRFTELSV